MNILFLDTTSSIIRVALLKENTFYKIEKESPKDGSASLITLIQEITKTSNTQIKELNNIVVITGPGSFTGIRIGLAFAKGLRLALNLPIIGINLFEAFILTEKSAASYKAVLLNSGKKDTLYIQIFNKQNKPVIDAKEHNLPEIKKLLKEYKEIHITGNSKENIYPNIETLLNIIKTESAKENFIKAHTLTPLYIRPHYASCKK